MDWNELYSSVSLALLFFRPIILWKEVPRRIDFVRLFISEESTNLLSYVIALFPIIRLYHGTDLNWRQLIIHKYHCPPFFHSAKLVLYLVGQRKASIDFSFEVFKWEIKANIGTFWIGILCFVIRPAALPEFDSQRRNNFFLKYCIESNLEIRVRRRNNVKCWFIDECDISAKLTFQHNALHAKLCPPPPYCCSFQRNSPVRTRTVSVKTLRNVINKSSLLDWQNHHEHTKEFCRLRKCESSNGTKG